MSADHGNGVDEPALLDQTLTLCRIVQKMVDLGVSNSLQLIDLQRRLEQIENGGKKTVSATMPTCESTEAVSEQENDDITPERKALYRWREKNREHYLAKQREYQRAYRARKKEKGGGK